MAKTYANKTKDNEVFDKNSVQVEVTDDTPTKTIVTPGSLNTERAVLITLRDNTIAAITVLDAKIVLIDIEASKIVLKVPE